MSSVARRRGGCCHPSRRRRQRRPRRRRGVRKNWIELGGKNKKQVADGLFGGDPPLIWNGIENIVEILKNPVARYQIGEF